MNIEEARLYLEHTLKDDFILEEWQNENRYQAIQVVLEEIERLNNDIKELLKENSNKEKVIIAQDNIINEFEDFITEVDSHINLGDESEEFILVRDKWVELQELKGVDKE